MTADQQRELGDLFCREIARLRDAMLRVLQNAYCDVLCDRPVVIEVRQ